MEIRTRAPHRLEFAGGGTDVPPFTDTHGGLVFNAGIDLYAYAVFRPSKEQKVHVHSIDFGNTCTLDFDTKAAYDSNLDLVKSAWNVMHERGIINPKTGGDLFIESEVPPGSGLGGSSSVCCAIISALAAAYGAKLDKQAIGALAYDIERRELKMSGGLQDQYAAAFGGFSLMHFGKALSVKVEPVPLSPETLNELSFRMVLMHTGASRLSEGILDQQVGLLKENPVEMNARYEKAKSFARDMAQALGKGDVDAFGDLLNQAWNNKKQFCPGLSTPLMDNYFDTAKKHGAMGGRLMGAGRGGHLLFLAEPARRKELTCALENAGARVVRFRFDAIGTTSWKTRSKGE